MVYKFAQPTLTGGLDQTLVEVATAVPSFMIGFLVFVWGMVFLGGMGQQSARKGHGDAPLWATMASMSIMLLSLLLTLKEGMISGEILGIVVAITILSGIWLFMSKGRNEL